MHVSQESVKPFCTRIMAQFIPLAVVLVASACGGSEPPAEPAAEPAPPAAAAPMQASPRVFFVSPKTGETVKSPVHLVFGIEGYELAAVPTGTVTTARPGMGHHHLGVEMDCLSPGTVIVKGTPSWVHFGDAKTEFDLQLTPGPHKLALQFADDLHGTIEGLCEAITVTVGP